MLSSPAKLNQCIEITIEKHGKCKVIGWGQCRKESPLSSNHEHTRKTVMSNVFLMKNQNNNVKVWIHQNKIGSDSNKIIQTIEKQRDIYTFYLGMNETMERNIPTTKKLQTLSTLDARNDLNQLPTKLEPLSSKQILAPFNTLDGKPSLKPFNYLSSNSQIKITSSLLHRSLNIQSRSTFSHTNKLGLNEIQIVTTLGLTCLTSSIAEIKKLVESLFPDVQNVC